MIDSDNAIIRDRMARYLKATGITMAELSRRTGLCQASVHDYVHGRATPNMTALRKLVIGTGMPADWWIGTVAGR